jgi:phospholipid/cholesterol/gamma-HCH transport system substrate-binding protein
MRAEQSSAVKAGIFVILCGVLLVGIVVVLGKRSQLFTQQYAMYAKFDSAQGLMPGSPVRLAGVLAGAVGSVQLKEDEEDGGYSAWVRLDVAWRHKGRITESSHASIRTLGPLGDKYVEITPGAGDEPEILPGQTIATHEGEDWYGIAMRAREAVEQINRVGEQLNTALTEFNQTDVFMDVSKGVASLRRSIEKTEQGPGLLHGLIYDEKLPAMVADLEVAAASLRKSAERIEKGEGSLGELVYGDKLAQAVDDFGVAAGALKNVVTEIEGGDGAAHALIYDEKLRDALTEYGDAAGQLQAVLAAIQEGRGTLGLLIYDPETWESIKRILGGVEESRTLKYLIQREAEE